MYTCKIDSAGPDRAGPDRAGPDSAMVRLCPTNCDSIIAKIIIADLILL
jgi:hypothetical protein